jgi:hypothetical protein
MTWFRNQPSKKNRYVAVMDDMCSVLDGKGSSG